MKLHELSKTTTKSKKRLGQGYGSGKGGHTSSRGQKGQTSRGNTAIWFEGGQLPQIRRFPFIKGKNRFKSLQAETVVISLSQLNKFAANTVVDLKQLVDARMLSTKDIETKRVKVVANGKLDHALTVSLPTTNAASEQIIAAGGKVNREQTE
jgi:large subunit ribosomal protein L15